MNASSSKNGSSKRLGWRWWVGGAGVTALVTVAALVGGEVVARCDETPPTRFGSLRPSVVGRAVVIASGGVARVRSLVDGRVGAVHVREGDHVDKGAVLAELVNDAVESEVSRRRAEQRAAEASAASIQQGARVEERQEANAALEQAKRELELARDRDTRQRQLVDAGAASSATRVETESALSIAEARHSAALAHARLVNAGARAVDVTAARARAEGVRASVDAARFSAHQLNIVAPISGTVLTRSIDPGDNVSSVGVGAATSLFEIADTEHTDLKIEIEESDAIHLAPGLEVALISPVSEANARCVIDRIAPQMSRRSVGVDDARTRAEGLVRVAWCAVDAKGAGLVIGQRVDVRVVLPATEPTSLAPRDAVVVRDGRVALRTRGWLFDSFEPVAIGRVGDGEVEVFSTTMVR